MNVIIYDTETYPNIFSFCGYDPQTNQVFMYEMSDRKNQKAELLAFLEYYKNYYFVGYNNEGFDYPIVHQLMVNHTTFTYQKAAQLCNDIIHSRNSANPYVHQVRFQERILQQIDLYKLNHFDNRSKATSLKALQFAMRAESVEDLPFDIRPLTDPEKDVLIEYNIHDVMETYRFYTKCKHLIEMRKELLDSKMIYGNVLNYSDVKIGAEFLIKQIGRDKCFTPENQPRQTLKMLVQLKDIILDKIHFVDEAYDQVREWFSTLTWYKDQENNISKEFIINNFTYQFGMGGIHGSVENKFFESNDDWTIVDLDVASLYPSISIVNNFYPQHLGQTFVDRYRELKAKRFEHKKGTALNAMFKLALNGAFGNSNNPYSCFYDPSYLLKITINGQLQLLQLAELLLSVPNVKPIQVNTDGITCYVHKDSREFFNIYKDFWQQETGLELEEVEYKRIWIKDVNNYLCLTKDKKIKAKGAYWFPETEKDHDGAWNKDYSAMVVQKAIRHVLMDGVNPEYIVRLFTDPYDFMLRYKTPYGAKVYVGDKQCTKTVRYYVAKKGNVMKKIAMPKGELGQYKRKNSLSDVYFSRINDSIPKGTWDARIHTANKSTYQMVETEIESGRIVCVCNNVKDFDWSNLDYEYYIKEVEKLLI